MKPRIHTKKVEKGVKSASFCLRGIKMVGNLIIVLMILFYCYNGYASIKNGVKINVIGGTYLNVKGNIINDVNAQLINNGNLILSGDLINHGTLTANGIISIIEFRGNTSQHCNVGTYTSSLINLLKINNTGGVILDAPINTVTLTLISGNLTSTATNLLSVTGTNVTNIIGGSSSAYVIGPLARTLPSSLSSGSTYSFPIGKSNFNLYEMINPTTNAANTVVITAEVFDAIAGGTDGTGFSSVPIPAKYWKAEVSGADTLSSAGTIRLFDPDMTLSNNVIGCAPSQTGVYSSVGGININSPLNGNISSNSAIPLTLGYFKIGSSTLTIVPPINNDSISVFLSPNGKLVINDLQADKNISLKIFNALGQMVFSNLIDDLHQDNEFEIDITHFIKGMYIVQLKTSSNILCVKIMKQ